MAVETKAAITPRNNDSRERIHLGYLDGLRGLAALWVVLGHVYIAMRFWSPAGTFPTRIMSLMSVTNVGQMAVDIFIVLSGYCLMLPVAMSSSFELRGGAVNYIRRRARRIIPPYYAAIVLSLLIVALTDRIHPSPEQALQHQLRPDNLILHLLLLHNLFPQWLHGIDPPMWSVATEWQIYFLLPFVLLPVWRRLGLPACIAIGFVLGYLPSLLFRHRFDGAFPWFIGLFALGVAGAVISFRNESKYDRLRTRLPWGTFSLALWLAIASCSLHKGWYHDHSWLADPIIGLATLCLLVYCTQHFAHTPVNALPPVPRLLNSRWAVALGGFSYSIYLIHYPILELLFHAQMRLAASGLIRSIITVLVIVPVVIAVSYLFHLYCERPFISQVQKPKPGMQEA